MLGVSSNFKFEPLVVSYLKSDLPLVPLLLSVERSP